MRIMICLNMPRYIFCLNKRTVNWNSSNKDTVVLSTTKIKYIVILEVTKGSCLDESSILNFVWLNEL